MKILILLAALVGTYLTLTSHVLAQEIPRGEYLRYVPLEYPRLVQQTTASRDLQLFGDPDDPDYRDADPIDGIDDRRHQTLLSLGVRFAPFLIQNTTNIPTNFDVYIENTDSFALNIDTWNISDETTYLTRTEEINYSMLGQSPCPSSEAAVGTSAEAETDCRMQSLLNRFAPWAPQDPNLAGTLVRSRPDLFSVFFFDFPGEDPKSWELAYEAEYEKTPEDRKNAFPHAYLHPFVEQVVDTTGSLLGYELVLQYWFFYPTNDGGNNHEGDWEHLNVLVAPRSEVKRPLSRETLEDILTGQLSADDDAEDPLVIRRLDYYFHHFVMTLDFTQPNAYAPREEWQQAVKAQPRDRFQENEIWKAIRQMAYATDDETEINTHPFAYIGADNKGFDQVLATPGGKNRNSHGTFPFPGRYHHIGPGGATEQISVHVDPRKHLRDLRTGKKTMGPVFKRGSVLGLADPERIRIVPDWERIETLVRTNVRARRDWSWLVLPIRWGYPATESPFAGIVAHSETGNLAPAGPSYSLGWNVIGAGPGFHEYEPHILPSVFPLGFQDGFRNDFGFFNLTLPLLLNLPPLDFATRIVAYPFRELFGRSDPAYFPRENVPFRFFGLSSGVSLQMFDDDYEALAFNEDQFDGFLNTLVMHLLDNGADSTTMVTGGEDLKEKSVQPFFQITFYIGGKFTSENTVRNARTTFGFDIRFNNIPDYSYRADLNLWEYAGSIRYSLSASNLQPFLKGGYGWSWYRLENVQVSGVPFNPENSSWIKPGSIWPGVWHLGLGVEYVPFKRVGRFPGGMEVALRVEYGRYFQNLGLDLSRISLDRLGIFFPTLADVPKSGTVTRDDFVFGLSLTW